MRSVGSPVGGALASAPACEGSVIGSPATMRRMLSFAAEHAIAPITERMPLARANEAVTSVREGRARMRIILDV